MADPEASQVYTADTVGVLDAQTTLGQTIVSRRANLNGITIWLTPAPQSPNDVTKSITQMLSVKLFHSPTDTSPVFSTLVVAPTGGTYVPVAINIPNQKNQAGQVFYLLLSVNAGSLQVNGRSEDAYPGGQVYINNQPINADIAFRATYNYTPFTLLQDLSRYLGSVWLVALLAVLIWLPGWLLLDVSGLGSRFDFGARTAISVGLSLALVPVVMLWTTVLGLKWSRGAVWFAAGFLLAILIARMVYRFVTARKASQNFAVLPPDSGEPPPKKIAGRINLTAVALMLIFLVSLAVRLVMVRDLATPAWVDSVHHALITRLIVNEGAYPSSYLPYLDFSPSAYHPGFHSIAATFTWLSNLSIDQSLLVLGQVLNALCIFSVYLLATTLTRSSTTGLLAAFITGFLSPMPAYYTSWGRYTELTGLLVLPLALALLQLWLDEKSHKNSVWIILLGALAFAGLFMIHYRVTAFLLVLLVAYLIVRFAFKSQRPLERAGRSLLFVLVMGVASIILVLPWFIPTLRDIVVPRLVTPASPSSVTVFQDFPWSYLTSALGKQALVLAALGLLWSVIQRRAFVFILMLWVILMFLLANPGTLRLPGADLVNNTSVQIMLFIPISILGGYFIHQLLIEWQGLLPSRFNLVFSWSVAILFSLVAFIGASQLVSILNPVTILSRNADLPAIQWVDDHIPKDEMIVLNPFAWGYGLYAANDGGYWISPLSGRQTLPPPVLYGLGSKATQISQQCEQIIELSGNPPALRDYLSSQQVRYLYLGARGGVISPAKLSSSGLFDVLYHQDGVWIFAVKP